MISDVEMRVGGTEDLEQMGQIKLSSSTNSKGLYPYLLAICTVLSLNSHGIHYWKFIEQTESF